MKKCGSYLFNWIVCGSLACGGWAVAQSRAQDKPATPQNSPQPTPTPTPEQPAQPEQPQETPVPDMTPETPEMPEQADLDENARFTLPSTDHNFGEIWAGELLNYTFEVKNEGTAVLRIVNVQPSCGCTVSKEYDKEIQPGQTGKIPLSLNTSKISGQFTKTIHVSCNDKAQPRVTLKLTGSVKRYVTIDPPRADLGTVNNQEEKTATIKLTNNFDQPMEPVLEKKEFGAFTAELTEKEKGKEYELVIKGKPPYQEGRNQAIIEVKTNFPQESVLRVTATAMMPQRLEVQPQFLMIPETRPGETEQQIMLVNNGNTPVKLQEATVDDEKLTLTTIATEEGKNYTVKVKIPADYKLEAGVSKTITLKTDDSEKPVLTVPLRSIVRPVRPALTLQGQQVPTFELPLNSGATLKSADIKDQPVVLIFYATWCPHCKKSLPEIEKTYQAYKEKGVRFVAINEDDPNDPGPARKFTRAQALDKLKELGVTFDVAFDADRKVYPMFKSPGFPTTFIVDKTGKISKVQIGEIIGPAMAQFTQNLDEALGVTATKAMSDAPPTSPEKMDTAQTK